MHTVIRTGSSFTFSQWETALLCNDVFHWLGANLASALVMLCVVLLHLYYRFFNTKLFTYRYMTNISTYMYIYLCFLVVHIFRYIMFHSRKRIRKFHLQNDGSLYLPHFVNRENHYSDVIMTAMAPQIISLTIVYSTLYSGADQRKHQTSASLAFVRRIDRWPVNSPHKGPLTRERFPFDDVIMHGQ